MFVFGRETRVREFYELNIVDGEGKTVLFQGMRSWSEHTWVKVMIVQEGIRFSLNYLFMAMVYWNQKFLCQIMNFTQRVSMREHCWGQIMPYLNSIPSVYRIFRTIKRIFFLWKRCLKSLCLQLYKTEDFVVHCTLQTEGVKHGNCSRKTFRSSQNEEVIRDCKKDDTELQKVERRYVLLRVLLSDRNWKTLEHWKTAHRKKGIHVFTKIIIYEGRVALSISDIFSVPQM